MRMENRRLGLSRKVTSSLDVMNLILLMFLIILDGLIPVLQTMVLQWRYVPFGAIPQRTSHRNSNTLYCVTMQSHKIMRNMIIKTNFNQTIQSFLNQRKLMEGEGSIYSPTGCIHIVKPLKHADWFKNCCFGFRTNLLYSKFFQNLFSF